MSNFIYSDQTRLVLVLADKLTSSYYDSSSSMKKACKIANHSNQSYVCGVAAAVVVVQ